MNRGTSRWPRGWSCGTTSSSRATPTRRSRCGTSSPARVCRLCQVRRERAQRQSGCHLPQDALLTYVAIVNLSNCQNRTWPDDIWRRKLLPFPILFPIATSECNKWSRCLSSCAFGLLHSARLHTLFLWSLFIWQFLFFSSSYLQFSQNTFIWCHVSPEPSFDSGSNKHQSAVTCLQFNSKFVITSSDDGTVKLWDVKTGEWKWKSIFFRLNQHGR